MDLRTIFLGGILPSILPHFFPKCQSRLTTSSKTMTPDRAAESAEPYPATK